VKYVIVRTGIYDQGVAGMADSLEEARTITEDLAQQEKDLYHKFEIREKETNNNGTYWTPVNYYSRIVQVYRQHSYKDTTRTWSALGDSSNLGRIRQALARKGINK